MDWFLVGMVAAVGLAALLPGPGANGGILHPELLTKLGVALLFFLHGVSISFDAMRAGTLRWPIHLVVQGCTFVFFPVLGIFLLLVAGRWLPPDLHAGFFFLCALPSTVSSSVAMTAAAKGNVPVAVFNATLSSLIGVFLTPLWLGWLLSNSGAASAMPMGKVIVDLLLWLVLPLVLGQLSRPLLGGWAQRNKALVSKVDRGTILLLVYTSFCESFVTGVWSNNGFLPVATTLIGVTLLFFIVLLGTQAVSNACGFNPADRAAAVFCGSKKTLASGVPMAQLIFSGHAGISLILLPIMIYHPLQLLVCGVLAGRWARQANAAQAAA